MKHFEWTDEIVAGALERMTTTSMQDVKYLKITKAGVLYGYYEKVKVYAGYDVPHPVLSEGMFLGMTPEVPKFWCKCHSVLRLV